MSFNTFGRLTAFDEPDFADGHPRPPLRKLRQLARIHRRGFLVLLLPPVVPRHLPLRPQLGELRLLPPPPPLGADPLEQLLGRLHVGVLLPPVCREIAAEGGCEHGLAEALEERGDGVERLLGAAAPGGEGLDLGDDAALLSSRWQQYGHFQQLCRIDAVPSGSVVHLI
ncbi:hypothetical protein BE11_39125 [Sorangium cellulosum]|nr:hypothetical protein BE11_39125 [Sorangium cellulosum]